MSSGDLQHEPLELFKEAEGPTDDPDVMLDRFSATPEEKEELVAVLRGMMENFVDRAFGIDPVQQVTAAANAELLSANPTASPRTRRQRGRARRRRAPHVNRVSNSIKRRRTQCSRNALP